MHVERHQPLRLFALLSAMLIGGCSEPPGDGVNLGLVEYWPEQRIVFVASRRSGHVDVMRLPSHAGASGFEYVDRLHHPGRRHVVRLVMDRDRGKLWVAGLHEVQVYGFNPPSVASIQISVASGSRSPRVSDLTLDAEGNAFAYTRGGALIYRIDAKTHVHEKWLEPFGHAMDGALIQGAYNRALHTRDQRHVMFQTPVYGAIAHIDLQSKKVAYLEVIPPLDFSCGILFWKHGADSFQAIDCNGRWTAEIAPQPAAGRALVHRNNTSSR